MDILQLKKGTSVTTLHQRNVNVSLDVTFNEDEFYFTIPYLQGENSIHEDKDGELVLELSPLPSTRSSALPNSSLPDSGK